jgi:NAD(P)-dependent dehydrogenase (short-subunit alcohol dehydrogenase family)
MSGHHVLVTGGAQGIGAAIARKAPAEGGFVTAVDRSGAALDQFAAS